MRRAWRLVMAIFCLIFLWVACGPLAAHAQIPRLIHYQGKLTDAGGTPLEGAYDLTFRIYDAQEAGSLLWQEAHAGVVIEGGLFDVLLGSATSLDLAFDIPYFLEIKVGQEVMAPRQRLAAAAYAFRAIAAEDADTVGGYAVSAAPAANKLLPMNGNGYLPASALRVFDSGWFAATYNTTYTKIHNLGTTKVIPAILLSTTADGSGLVGFPLGQHFDAANAGRGTNIVTLTATTISVYGINYLGRIYASTTCMNIRSGYLRIILIALE